MMFQVIAVEKHSCCDRRRRFESCWAHHSSPYGYPSSVAVAIATAEDGRMASHP